MPNRNDDTIPVNRDDRDEPPAASIRIVREVPLWGIVTGLFVLCGQAVALYYGQQRLSEQMVEVRAEVRALGAAAVVRERENVSMQYQLSEMQRRLQSLEQSVRR